MKTLLLYICCMFMLSVSAQNAPETTRSFTIKGKVKQEIEITYNTLLKYPSYELRDVNTSCSPKKEERFRLVKAVLLKDLLDSVVFDYEKGAQLNEFYFVFVAADGYKIVYSYNEIFNTETGLNLYVATDFAGKPATELPNALLVLTTSDIKGGRRNMKWLKEIRVCRAD